MIILQDVTTVDLALGKKRRVLNSVSLQIPTDRRIGVVSPSISDTLDLIDLLSGLVLPTSGRIVRLASVSFPVGYLGGFDQDLSIRFNVAHVARLYGADVASVVDLVQRTADLGPAFDRPYGDLPRRERRELGEIVAYSLPFDMYVLATNPKRLQRESNTSKSAPLFESRFRTSGMMMPARNLKSVREFCDMGLVLNQGRLQLFDDIGQASRAAGRPRRRDR